MDSFDKFYYHDANYNRKYNTDDFYTQISTNVSQELKRPLEENEKRQVVNFIRKLDQDVLKPIYVNKSIPIIIKTLVNEFSNFNCNKPQDTDTQQILRNTIGISSESGTSHGIYDDPAYIIKRLDEQKKIIKGVSLKPPPQIKQPTQIKQPETQLTKINTLLGLQNANEAVRVLNPKSQYRKNYMLLDSRYRNQVDQSPPDISSFSWNYVQKNQDTVNGSVNVIGNVRDVIALQIHPFRIPYNTTADNKYQRITVLIEELSSQAYVAHEKRKFQWMMMSKIDSEFIDLSNDCYKDNFFVFEKPITTLETITVTFGNPLEPITFDRDRDYCALDYFALAPLTQITTEKPHNLSSGDRIYVTDFTVAIVNPVLNEQKRINDKIQEDVNSINGYLVTIISPTVFSIPLDTSNIQAIDPNTRPKVFYGSKRLFIPLTIHYIKPEIEGVN